MIDYLSMNYNDFKEIIKVSKLNNEFKFKLFLFNLKRSKRDLFGFNTKNSFSKIKMNNFLLNVFDYFWNNYSMLYNERISIEELFDNSYNDYTAIMNIALREIDLRESYPDYEKLFYVFLSKKDLKVIVSRFDPLLSESKFYYEIESKLYELLYNLFFESIDTGWLSKEEFQNFIKKYQKEFYKIK